MALELHICPNELKPARTGNLSNKLQPVSIVFWCSPSSNTFLGTFPAMFGS